MSGNGKAITIALRIVTSLWGLCTGNLHIFVKFSKKNGHIYEIPVIKLLNIQSKHSAKLEEYLIFMARDHIQFKITKSIVWCMPEKKDSVILNPYTEQRVFPLKTVSISVMAGFYIADSAM